MDFYFFYYANDLEGLLIESVDGLCLRKKEEKKKKKKEEKRKKTK